MSSSWLSLDIYNMSCLGSVSSFHTSSWFMSHGCLFCVETLAFLAESRPLGPLTCCLFTTSQPQPFYGPLSGNTRVSRCQKRTSGLYMAQGKINRGRHTDHPDGCHSIRTNQCPPPPSPIAVYLLNIKRLFLQLLLFYGYMYLDSSSHE